MGAALVVGSPCLRLSPSLSIPKPDKSQNPIPKSPQNPKTPKTHLKLPIIFSSRSLSSETHRGIAAAMAASGAHSADVAPDLVEEMVHEALVWSSLHGLVVGDKSAERSGTVPGVGLVHAPLALLPMPFPEHYWRQACELTPIFNELVDCVSLDGKFLQDSLSRTKKVDAFTSRLLDIHSEMLEINKKEDIRLGLHRSDYMLDAETGLLLQIELNTIASSFPGLSTLVSKLHRTQPRRRLPASTATMKKQWNLLSHYGNRLGLDSRKVPGNSAVSQFAEALAKAWKEYDNSSSVVLVVVQPEEHNMYDQHWLSSTLKEMHGITSVRKTLAEIDAEGEVLPDGSLIIGGHTVAVVYFRAGYSPNDYPSESEWRARFSIEKSNAIKCPSISYHLAGTKKIQQELAKPNVLERFLENEEDIAKLRKCFAGLWSLDNPEGVNGAMERPEIFVLKPQREGGGNNIYGEDVRKTLVKLQQAGSEELAAYILMQRIFPKTSLAYLVRKGKCYQDQVISELGIYGAYLRNKDKVVMNAQPGYLMRTKVSSSNEGGVAAGFAVLDSIYLI
ncbi:glutathione synthetase, chloroplastic-like isoform X4 [Asparagus officinalis]|uniref:glutathione synthetase, chloroplastic-like isoform X3 n=1 Tax=Asparagus officinalis TaxID=4686 RepID=UPI00098E5168|nr:glutathione synthetase, chloroplastic-like isoform X3 [Asparagus officinalis]XP_020254704.1 glutathione synthetase, chloroplastic-like isoform X4 [Asparagus officinalis]